jgi:hypothetical protein
MFPGYERSTCEVFSPFLENHGVNFGSYMYIETPKFEQIDLGQFMKDANTQLTLLLNYLIGLVVNPFIQRPTVTQTR